MGVVDDRYERQRKVRFIGDCGQEKLAVSRVAIVGVGALGGVQAELLCRAGVGFIRIIDQDVVDLKNLHRQILYSEKDVSEKMSKVEAARDHLRGINSDVVIEEVDAFLDSGNAEALLTDVDLVMDATDNMETRYLINEVCVKHGIPWVYGGAVETEGMTMNVVPGGPCLSCMTGRNIFADGGERRTAKTVGVLNTLPVIVSSIQCTEAVKILTESDKVRKSLLFLDLWESEAEEICVEKNPDCPVCGKGECWYLTHDGK